MRRMHLILGLAIVLAIGQARAASEYTEIRQFTAGGVLSSGVLVKLSATTGKVTTCGAGEDAIGVTRTTANGDGSLVAVRLLYPSVTMTSAKALAIGANLYPAASGQVSDTVSGQRVGICMTTASGASETVEVLRAPLPRGLVYADTISENSSATGVTADSVLLKDGEGTFKAGTSTETYKPGGIISADLADHATAGTSEEDLATYTLPANTLSENGRGIRIRCWGVTAANANNKTIRILLDDTVLVTTGALAANDKDWEICVDLYREGAAAQRSICTGQANGAIIQVDAVKGVEDLTAALDIDVKATTPTAAADVTMHGFIVEFK